MTRAATSAAFFIAITALGQTSGGPAVKFEIADVHTAAKGNVPFGRSLPPRNGRYEVRNASIVDLIRFAYGFEEDKILGGPSWIEMDRFDIVAKEPLGTNGETRKTMLQAVLGDRFGLVVRQETRPMPAYALMAGKTPRIRPADGSEQTGCGTAPASDGPPVNGRIMMMEPNGTTTTIDLGPGNTVSFMCRNITMAAFAAGLPDMFGRPLGNRRVVDETGLKGAWNFDVKWSIGTFGGPSGDAGQRVTVADAVEKQLGLKLADRQLPTPVIVIEKVNRTPTENVPNVAEQLPKVSVPTEFEVSDVKPSAPGPARGGIGLRVQPGGRVTAQRMPLRNLVSRAFSDFDQDQIIGLPAMSVGMGSRFDITAKTPEGVTVTMNDLPPLLRSLLVERFKLKYHSEERELTAYSLVAAKPKLKKADPESRAFCKEDEAPPPAPANARSLTCQNVTMAQFGDRLTNLTPDLKHPILDETGIEGTWDFTLTYTMGFGVPPIGLGLGGGAGGPGGPLPEASDPTGGIPIFDAVQKQLGLKLEARKRRLPVIVIDHIEQQPTEN